MNNIIELLNIKDKDIEVKNIEVEGEFKVVTLEKRLVSHFCPECGSIMHSRGITVRRIRHPILQDGYKLILKMNQRRWRCTNPKCKYEENDHYHFLNKYKQLTNITPYLVCEALKDIETTCEEVGKRFNITGQTVHNYFMHYVECPPLPLPEILCVDEVYLNLDEKHKYQLVLMDFATGQIVDILESRRKEDTQQYFYNIPLKQRNNVKYLVCDMYNPYINYTRSYFTKAQVIIDSFHVISWLNNKLNLYINKIKSKYQQRDKEKLKQDNEYRNIPFETVQDSNEVYLLKNYRFFLLSDIENIDYRTERWYSLKLCQYVDTYTLEKLFLDLDDNFRVFRDLKQLYIDFNNRNCGKDPIEIEPELNEIIKIYYDSGFDIFIEFSFLLKRYKDYIIASFKLVQGNYNGLEIARRLSNGPMESFNRKPKDLKRLSRGFNSFKYVRNRILWATRYTSFNLNRKQPKHTYKDKNKDKKK